MRLSEFLTWSDAMPELQRQEDVQQIQLLTLVGQRAVRDEDFRREMRRLSKRIKPVERKLDPEAFKKLQASADRLNRICRAMGMG